MSKYIAWSPDQSISLACSVASLLFLIGSLTLPFSSIDFSVEQLKQLDHIENATMNPCQTLTALPLKTKHLRLSLIYTTKRLASQAQQGGMSLINRWVLLVRQVGLLALTLKVGSCLKYQDRFISPKVHLSVVLNSGRTALWVLHWVNLIS